jgi:hypothetical protein
MVGWLDLVLEVGAFAGASSAIGHDIGILIVHG